MRTLLFVVAVSTSFGLAYPLSAGLPTSVSGDLCRGGHAPEPITRQSGLPTQVRAALAHAFQQRKLSIADPGEEFQQTDFVVLKPGKKKLPTRRLLFAFRTADHFVVYYESVSAGLGANALVFSMRGADAKLLWGGVEVDHDKLAKNPAELKQRICKGRLISDRAFLW